MHRLKDKKQILLSLSGLFAHNTVLLCSMQICGQQCYHVYTLPPRVNRYTVVQ